jgi:glycosyltransferase involved in cell wall biosynthesis
MLTIIIPAFNEINTIEEIITRVNKIDFIPIEIILVDDHSTDGSRDLIKKNLYKKVTRVIYQAKNLGKGFAIKAAQKFVNGDIVIIQDADLEYNPKDYEKMVRLIIDNKAEVVYGSRVLGKNRYTSNNFTSVFRIFGNHILTIISNIINRQNLTDAHTCYKLFKSDIFKKINLEEKGFSFCPEITTKISNMKIDIIETPISYEGRNYKNGKKIRFKDAIEAIKTLIKYKFFKK